MGIQCMYACAYVYFLGSLYSKAKTEEQLREYTKNHHINVNDSQFFFFILYSTCHVYQKSKSNVINNLHPIINTLFHSKINCLNIIEK